MWSFVDLNPPHVCSCPNSSEYVSAFLYLEN